MKIAVFTNNYLPNLYGVSTSIESFRRQLEKKGHTVYIFAPFFKNYQDDNPRVFRYPSLDIKYKIRFPLPIPFSQKMKKVLNSLEIDIIHSQHPNLLGSAAYFWSQKKNIPLVFTWHTLYDHYTNFIPLLPGRWVAKRAIQQAVKYANRVDQLIVPTPSVKTIIQEWGVINSHIQALPTGIDENKFQDADGSQVRRRYKIQSQETVLLLVSRLTEEKNVEFIFQSLVPLLENNSSIKFLVVGEGYLKDQLKKKYARGKLASKIIFTGLINKAEIKNYYAAGDIFVYASQSETQGLIIAEALYMQLPVVAVKATGIQDILADSEAGILVSEKENDFRNSVKELIDNNEKREKMGETGKKLVKEKYTSQVCANQLEKIYENLLLK